MPDERCLSTLREIQAALEWLVEDRLHALEQDRDTDALTQLIPSINDLAGSLQSWERTEEAIRAFFQAYQEFGTRLEVESLTRKAVRDELIAKGGRLLREIQGEGHELER